MPRNHLLLSILDLLLQLDFEDPVLYSTPQLSVLQAANAAFFVLVLVFLHAVTISNYPHPPSIALLSCLPPMQHFF